MTSAEIRKAYIDFFVQKHGHTFVPSSPVVPHDDPTLLFTNAGMNQFKPYFLGAEKAPWRRVANTQKCIRAGGKHNDLDDVGRSRRHHTFFEMLGNWSFGDYFKQGAIEMAWELLTKVWKLDPERLHVTCYEGDEKNGIPRDTEAAAIWKKVANLPDDHIHYFGKDNFWEMGDTGPCGPCTEIYVDRTPGKAGGKDVNGEDPRVMEIWNLVFIQYNRDASGKLTPLPSQHVDTGMGFERISQVLQDKDDNYGTDLWTPLFEAISRISNLKYMGLFPKTNAADPVAEAANPQLRHDIAFRVIADHVRCLTFALTDGAVPSNEGRGYVLRRILRRAVRFGRQQLNLKEPFLHALVPVVVDSMGETFPELRKNSQRVAEIIKDEEVGFGKTLDRGIKLFNEVILSQIHQTPLLPQLRERGCEIKITPAEEGGMRVWVVDPESSEILSKRNAEFADASWLAQFFVQVPNIDARTAFALHDTYGFPIDLTRIMAEERGMTVDIAGYEKLMEQARELARAGGKEGGSPVATLPPDAIARLQAEKIPPTNDEYKYREDAVQAEIRAIWDGEKILDVIPVGSALADGSGSSDEKNASAEADATGKSRDYAIILNHTNFYAEMGGQVGDAGVIASGAGKFSVQTTRAVGGYVLHIGHLDQGTLKVGDAVTATLASGRVLTEKNHTSTHLANWALREVLGEGVQQKGSLVDPMKLRFDFVHGKAMTDEELAKVEMLVNDAIAKKLPVFAQNAPQADALKINGLRAVFGEKYPPMVRVVSIGVPLAQLLHDPGNSKWRQYSIEFCGGTHLGNTFDAGAFVVTSEESVSKGIRRIVALTGNDALDAAGNGAEIDSLITRSKSIPEAEIPDVIEAFERGIVGEIPLRAKRRAQAAVAELQAKLKAWEKTNKKQGGAASNDAILAAATELLDSAITLGGAKVVVGELAGATDEQLRTAMDSLKKRAPSSAILLGSSTGEDKVTFVAAVSDDVIAKGLKAGDWIRETAKVAGGGGGGRPQMAQAGGKDPSKLQDALNVAREFASKTVH
jgi:alanyl-tRNA synthetase